MMIVRIDSPSRLRNCEITLRYYGTSFQHVYVIEVDIESRIPNEIKESFPNVTFLFVKDDSLVFHRTHYMNYAFHRLAESHRFIAHIDVDILVPHKQLASAYEIISEGNIPMVIPYSGECISLNEDSTMEVYFSRGFIGEPLRNIGEKMFGNYSVGGAYLVNVHLYQEFGLENENFIGWGPEDLERVLRLDILGYPPLRVDGQIFHLNHYRGENSGDNFDHVTYQTKKELSRICSYNKHELIDYISTWPWARTLKI